NQKFSKATLDGKPLDEIIKDKKVSIKFPGKSLKKARHRKIGDLKPCDVPEDAEALYEATCFAADNNALEIRSLQRSGPSNIPCVQKARQAFLDQPMFINRAIWDKNLFDGDMNTFFIARYEGAALRIDFGEVINIDELVIKIQDIQARNNNRSLNSFAEENKAEISKELKTWEKIGSWSDLGYTAIARLYEEKFARYVRIEGAPARIAEIEGFFNGEKLDRSQWRASNLFFPYGMKETVSAYSTSFQLDELAKGSYLAIAINGKHGDEGAYAAIRVDGKLVGSPDRSVSFPSNTWEYKNVSMKENYTYYVPLTEDMVGKKIDAVVLISEKNVENLKPEVWITAYPNPFESKELVLYE
ncbi:MAG: discoidin domain-containing protein, partial [Prolixibacteraceae bacterium]|nr:discoidin domain-containing protein [Prolixibacteraceae bacterium]